MHWKGKEGELYVIQVTSHPYYLVPGRIAQKDTAGKNDRKKKHSTRTLIPTLGLSY